MHVSNDFYNCALMCDSIGSGLNDGIPQHGSMIYYGSVQRTYRVGEELIVVHRWYSGNIFDDALCLLTNLTSSHKYML